VTPIEASVGLMVNVGEELTTVKIADAESDSGLPVTVIVYEPNDTEVT